MILIITAITITVNVAINASTPISMVVKKRFERKTRKIFIGEVLLEKETNF